MILCPIPTCPWSLEAPAIELPGVGALAGIFGPGVIAQAAANQHAQELEDAIGAHLKTHATLDWVQGIIAAERERGELWAAAVTDAFGEAAAQGLQNAVGLRVMQRAAVRAAGLPRASDGD